MISLRSRNGWELGLEMGELEEGEALSCNEGGGGDSSVDPDESFSYIDEKIHNLLGHFQKDFEGIVSAENLGAKYGFYGSFLPTYQRSPSWSHNKGTPLARNNDSPGSMIKIPEDQMQIPKLSSTSSPSWRSREAIGKAISLGNSLRGNGHRLPTNHAEHSSSIGVIKQPANPCDQKGLKVRIKVGSENLLTQKNAEIYSGLGLEISPSSSLDGSPIQVAKHLHGIEESPTSILRIMTSFPGDNLLLSPLPGSVINLIENARLKGKCEDKTIQVLPNGPLSSKNGQRVLKAKPLKSSERNETSSPELANQTFRSDQDANISYLNNEKEADADILDCAALVSNADPLKGTLDVNVQEQTSLNEHLISEPIRETHRAGKSLGRKSGSRRKLPESKKGNMVNNIAASPQKVVIKAEKSPAFDQSEPDSSTRKKALVNKSSADPYESSVANAATSVSEGGSKRSIEKMRKEKKIVQSTGSQKSDAPKGPSMAVVVPSATPKSLMKSGANSPVPKNDSHYPLSDEEKPVDLYKDFFGDLEFEEDDNESLSGVITSVVQLGDPQHVSKRSSSESHGTSKEIRDAKKFGKPHASEKQPSIGSQVAPSLTSGHVLEAPVSVLPPNEDWVCCDKCAKWRLLPLGMNPNDLPQKWVCKMLKWLPGMNRCNVPENDTTNALRAVYNQVTSDIGPTSDEEQFVLNNSGQDPQNASTRSAPCIGKKIHRPINATSLSGVSGHLHTPELSGQASKSAGKEKTSLVNHSDKDTSIKVRSKRESELEDSRASKRVRSAEQVNHKDLRESGAKDVMSPKNAKTHSPCAEENSLLHLSRSDASRDSLKRRKSKLLNDAEVFSERHPTPVQCKQESDVFMEQMSENEHRKEKKARVSKSGLKDTTHGSKFSSGTDRKGRSTTMKHPFVASHSSSSKVSGSDKNNTGYPEEVKGSPVESVSSSPLRFATSEKVRPAKKNLVENDDFHEPRSLSSEEQPNSRKAKADEHSGMLNKGEKFSSSSRKISSGGTFVGSREQNHYNGGSVEVLDQKFDLSHEPANEKLPEKKDLDELTVTEKANGLSPLARVQNENVLNGENADSQRAQIPKKESENQNGQQPTSTRKSTPSLRRDIDAEAASPLRRDSSSQAANNALKEAKDLKHLADRMKGSAESNGLYFEAALKFLHGASLLESGTSESTKHNGMMKSMQIYSSTAKLFEFCALNYEKSNDMAAASLAYKCVEVAYMRVVYSSNATSSRDRNELQRALQIVPTGESPSSSASDIENMNNQARTDKAALATVSVSPNVSESHVLTSRTRAGFLRLLNFAQDVNSAMEASRKSRSALSAALSKLAETPHEEGINSLKKALDFNFHDIEALLLLVRVAMEAIGR